MIFDDIPGGSTVFLDANSLLYHFVANPQYGTACTALVERIERGEIRGVSSADVLSDVAHRAMTIEAMALLGWPQTGIAARLRRQRSEIPKLTLYAQATVRVLQIGIQVVPITADLVVSATNLSRQYELLSGDALIVAVMQSRSLVQLASLDADFDQVPWLARYAPA
jgi:predicted nucleic acid-binding protein